MGTQPETGVKPSWSGMQSPARNARVGATPLSRPVRRRDREAAMAVVRAAITQTTWTGDKESMLDRHEQIAGNAATQGAQSACFQELFYGPYFGIPNDQTYYRFAEAADGPIMQPFAALAKELGMV